MKTHIEEVVERLEAHCHKFRAHPADYGHVSYMCVEADDMEDLLREYKEMRYRMDNLEK